MVCERVSEFERFLKRLETCSSGVCECECVCVCVCVCMCCECECV